jgi:hypothetical protein
MEYVGIDMHKKESQICLLTETGEVMEGRIRTEPQRFAEVLGGRPRRESVGRPVPRGPGPRGRGGAPELRADVCHADSEGQDRSAGRPGPAILPRLEAGIRVADIGCGTGYCMTLMVTATPTPRYSPRTVAARRTGVPPAKSGTEGTRRETSYALSTS